MTRLRAHGPWLATAAVSMIWAMLTTRTPTNTYHFAPAIGALAWPATLRSTRGPCNPRLAAAVATAAFAVVAATGLELDALDLLRGPTMIGSGPLTEMLISAAIGALAGAAFAMHGRSRSRKGHAPRRAVAPGS